MKLLRHLMLCAAVFAIAPTHAATPKLTPAEAKAQAILREVSVKMKKHKTLTADFVSASNGVAKKTGRVQMMKPNFLLVQYESSTPFFKGSSRAKTVAKMMGNDGKAIWFSPYPFDDGTTYSHTLLKESNELMTETFGTDAPFIWFFNVEKALENLIAYYPKYIGLRKWKGKQYQVLKHDLVRGEENDQYRDRVTTWFYIGADFVLYRQVDQHFTFSRKNLQRSSKDISEVSFFNVDLDIPMLASQFEYLPPKGWRRWEGSTTEDIMQEWDKPQGQTQP